MTQVGDILEDGLVVIQVATPEDARIQKIRNDYKALENPTFEQYAALWNDLEDMWETIKTEKQAA